MGEHPRLAETQFTFPVETSDGCRIRLHYKLIISQLDFGLEVPIFFFQFRMPFTSLNVSYPMHYS